LNKEEAYNSDITAKRLRILRKKASKKMTMYTAASALGVAPTTYSDYEHGRRGLRGERLVAAASFFNTTTNYLLGTTDDDSPVDRIELENILNGSEFTYQGKPISEQLVNEAIQKLIQDINQKENENTKKQG
jgi:transcriptional regulator with XRE-family HTH domain